MTFNEVGRRGFGFASPLVIMNDGYRFLMGPLLVLAGLLALFANGSAYTGNESNDTRIIKFVTTGQGRAHSVAFSNALS